MIMDTSRTHTTGAAVYESYAFSYRMRCAANLEYPYAPALLHRQPITPSTFSPSSRRFYKYVMLSFYQVSKLTVSFDAPSAMSSAQSLASPTKTATEMAMHRCPAAPKAAPMMALTAALLFSFSSARRTAVFGARRRVGSLDYPPSKKKRSYLNLTINRGQYPSVSPALYTGLAGGHCCLSWHPFRAEVAVLLVNTYGDCRRPSKNICRDPSHWAIASAAD